MEVGDYRQTHQHVVKHQHDKERCKSEDNALNHFQYHVHLPGLSRDVAVRAL